MSEDYNLKKIYEQMLTKQSVKSISHNSKPRTLTEAFNQVFVNEAINDLHNQRPGLDLPGSHEEDTYKKSFEGNKSFNALIAKHLKVQVDQIPQAKNIYTIGTFDVKDEDKEIFNTLLPLAPPPKSGALADDNRGSKTTGNGEVALYWLLNSNPGYRVTVTAGSDRPDLTVHDFELGQDIGVEVKAYEEGADISLGRFGSQHDNIRLLSIVFGISTLCTAFQKEPSTPEPTLEEAKKRSSKKSLRPLSITSFGAEDLKNAAGDFARIYYNDELRAVNLDPIKNLYDRMDYVIHQLALKKELDPEKFTADSLAAALIRRILVTKLDVKPGFNGCIVNISSTHIEAYSPNEEIIKNTSLDPANDAELLAKVKANGAFIIIMNPGEGKLFYHSSKPVVKKETTKQSAKKVKPVPTPEPSFRSVTPTQAAQQPQPTQTPKPTLAPVQNS